MSLVTYNGITLPYSHITDFKQDTEMDPSGTDWYCSKFDVTVQTVINAAYLSTISLNLNFDPQFTSNAAAIMNRIRYLLMRPRRKLEIKFNDIDLIPNMPTIGDINAGTVDVQNGPIPQSCSINQLTNTTFLVTYHIIAKYWENIETNNTTNSTINSQGNNVLYNRWKETQDINATGFSTITREGKFIIRSDNVLGKGADGFRNQMAVIGVPRGCLRESSNYVISEDGLGISYRIVDKEVFKSPPDPAWRASGHFSISAPVRGGVMRFAEVQVRLEGSKSTKQEDLLKKAVQIAAGKIMINGGLLVPNNNPSASDFGVVESMSMGIDMYENRVECRIRSMLSPTQQRIGGIAFVSPNMVVTPETDFMPSRIPEYLSRGSMGWLLQAAAYFDPSIVGVQINKARRQLDYGIQPGGAGVKLEV